MYLEANSFQRAKAQSPSMEWNLLLSTRSCHVSVEVQLLSLYPFSLYPWFNLLAGTHQNPTGIKLSGSTPLKKPPPLSSCSGHCTYRLVVGNRLKISHLLWHGRNIISPAKFCAPLHSMKIPLGSSCPTRSYISQTLLYPGTAVWLFLSNSM